MNAIRFIDLFSGIGGFRLGLERAGSGWGIEDTRQPTTASPRIKERRTIECLDSSSERFYRCVWSCDNNKYANQVYTRQFGKDNHYTDDIRGVNPEDIPDFDLLSAGFPCQSFSVAGKRKGFQDTRGTLFFEILRVAEAKRPSLLLLENVKGLLNHDGGRTFTVILQALDELGYWVEWQVLNSKHFGVPQNRERVFIVGHLRETGGREIFPIRQNDVHCSEGDREEQRGQIGSAITGRSAGGNNARGNYVAYCLDSNYHKGISAKKSIEKKQRQLIIHNIYGGFQEGLRTFEQISPTIRTAKGGGHIPSVLTVGLIPEEERERQNYLPRERVLSDKGISRAISTNENQHPWYKNGIKIRRLTPIECERLQGFPDGWTEGISDTQRYKCLGNAVTVNVIEFLGGLIKSSWFTNKDEERSL